MRSDSRRKTRLKREEPGDVRGRDGRSSVQGGGEGGEEEERGEGRQSDVSRQNPSIHRQTVRIQRPESGSARTEGTKVT